MPCAPFKRPPCWSTAANSHFISSYDFLHKALPNCKSVLLPGGEHFGPLEQPELLTDISCNSCSDPQSLIELSAPGR